MIRSWAIVPFGRGVAVRIEDDAGRTGWGEASPLPGFSAETARDCARALEAALSRTRRIDPGSGSALVSEIDAAQPAARFALETALLDLEAQRSGRSLCELLSPAPVARAERAALCPVDIGQELARGTRCFKVKVARRPFAIERAELAALRARLPPGARIRIDANGGWSAAEAERYLAALAPLEIELAEQPVPPAAMRSLGAIAVPLAVDESLRSGDPLAELGPLLDRGAIAAFVLKPTLLGGLRRCTALAAEARRRGIDAIASHAFEGPIALAACAELALALGEARPHGVDHHQRLGEFPPVNVPQLGGDGIARSAARGLGVSP